MTTLASVLVVFVIKIAKLLNVYLLVFLCLICLSRRPSVRSVFCCSVQMGLYMQQVHQVRLQFFELYFSLFFFPDVLNKTASSIDEAPFFLVPNRTYIPQLLSWIMRSGRRQACEQRDYRYSYGELACCCSSSQSMGAQKDIQLLEL